MPYWDELTYDALPSSMGVFLKSAVYQRTFRSGKGRGRTSNTPVPTQVAEPYSYFDSVNSLKRDAYRKRFGDDGAIRPDRGHTWHMVRFDRSSEPLSWGQFYNGIDNGHKNVTLVSNSAAFAVPQPTNQSNFLDAYVKQQYSKAAPNSDRFNLSQFLGELREGLPALMHLKGSSLRDLERLLYGVRPGSIVTTSKDLVSTAGGNFVGYQFGLLPLVSDLQGMGMALYKATSALTGFSVPIHRRREKALTANVAVTDRTAGPYVGVGSNGYQAIPGLEAALKRDYNHPTGGIFSTWLSGVNAWSGTTEEGKMWYEAEYVLVPKIGFDPSSYLDRLEVLMNTEFTVSTLWELAPWSWLVDWLLKIGDSIVANETAISNRLVTNYAYGMCEQKVTSVITIKNLDLTKGSPYTWINPPRSYVSTQSVTVKRRVRANPFGFNPVSSSITRNEQWAILGALAASKGL